MARPTRKVNFRDDVYEKLCEKKHELDAVRGEGSDLSVAGMVELLVRISTVDPEEARKFVPTVKSLGPKATCLGKIRP